MKTFTYNLILFAVLFQFSIDNTFAKNSNNQILLDAIKLKAMIPSEISETAIVFDENAAEILKDYLHNAKTYSDIVSLYKNNPFIALTPIYNRSESTDSLYINNLFIWFPKGIKANDDTTKSLFSIPFLDVTNFAFGLTDFLIDRTKTELNIAFFERFKDEMTKDEYKDLRIFFPHTFQMLTAIGDQMYYYNNYIQGLRHAFETDLNRMPYQIRNWVDLQKDSIDASVYNTIRVGLITTTSIIENKHPGAILKDLSIDLKNLDKKQDDKTFQTFENLTHLVALISESFRDTNGADDYWVDGSKIRQLTDDDVLLRIYLGLLYQQIQLDSDKHNNIAFSNEITLLNLLDAIGENWKTYGSEAKRLISRFSTQINLTQNSVARFNEIKKRVKSNEELSNRERNYEMFNAYFDITTSMLDILRNIGLGMNEFTEGINKIDTAVGQKLQAIFSETELKKIGTGFIATIEATQKIGVYIFNKQYAGAVAQTFLILNSAQTTKNNQWQKFLKYGTFMANMVSADSPEAVTAAIEAVAAPPGSYSIKRNVNWSVALNGYLGIFTGNELICVNDQKGRAFNLALTAPVGLSINKGSIGNKSKHSLGLFFPIIDLGFVASYRFDEENSDVSALPKIQLKQLISPGLFLEWGLPKFPIIISAGWQTGPQLRESHDEEQQLSRMYHRFGVSLKADIPILYLKK
jgi:hypothetical protein